MSSRKSNLKNPPLTPNPNSLRLTEPDHNVKSQRRVSWGHLSVREYPKASLPLIGHEDLYSASLDSPQDSELASPCPTEYSVGARSREELLKEFAASPEENLLTPVQEEDSSLLQSSDNSRQDTPVPRDPHLRFRSPIESPRAAFLSKLDSLRLTPLKNLTARPYYGGTPVKQSAAADPALERRLAELDQEILRSRENIRKLQSLKTWRETQLEALEASAAQATELLTQLGTREQIGRKAAEEQCRQASEALGQDLLTLPYSGRWVSTGSHSALVYRHRSSFCNSALFGELFIEVQGRVGDFSARTFFVRFPQEGYFKETWDEYEKFIEKTLPRSSVEEILGSVAKCWEKYLCFLESVQRLGLGFPISCVSAECSSFTIVGTVLSRRWEIHIPYLSLDNTDLGSLVINSFTA